MERWRFNQLPFAYVNIAVERSTIFDGKIHYFYGYFQWLCDKLPEGTSIETLLYTYIYIMSLVTSKWSSWCSFDSGPLFPESDLWLKWPWSHPPKSRFNRRVGRPIYQNWSSESMKLACDISGWWFGTWIVFFHSVGNVIIPIDELTFFRGVWFNHQPDIYIYKHIQYNYI